jgi:thymidylate synthase (FAD)
VKVKLISYTYVNTGAFVDDDGVYTGHPQTIKELVAYCARVSNPSNQFNSKTADKLLEYLIEHKHWSPFEMVNLCLEITTTRDIARQILRHRSFSFQEFSQRYADPTKELSFVLREARLQDKSNRQNSIETSDKRVQEAWDYYQRAVKHASLDAYNWAIKNGLAKEVARSVLPEGMMESRMYMNGTLRSWLHYLDLRTKNGTQKEHVEVALACAEAIASVFHLE